jgi:predicted MFS family arabinose efflux permease
VLHGFAFGSLGTLGLALAIDVSGGRRAGVSMAWYTAANSTGYATGALVGGTLADTIGIPATLGLIGLLPVLAAVAVLALPPIEAAPFPSDRGSGLRGLLAAGRRLDSRVWLAFALVLYLNVLMDSVDTFFPVFAPTIGISLATVGVLRAIKSGSAIFIRSTGVVLLRAVDYRRVTLIAVIAAAAAAMTLPVSSSLAVLVPIFIVSGLARGVLRATSAATIAELRNEGRDVGLASGIYNSGLDIGTIVGPALGGIVASVFGIAAMFQIIAVLSLLAWLAVAISSPVTREAAGLGKRHTIGPTA